MTDDLIERQKIVTHLQTTAVRIMIDAFNRDQYALERAEMMAAVLEEAAAAIECGDHLREES